MINVLSGHAKRSALDLIECYLYSAYYFEFPYALRTIDFSSCCNLKSALCFSTVPFLLLLIRKLYRWLKMYENFTWIFVQVFG